MRRTHWIDRRIGRMHVSEPDTPVLVADRLASRFAGEDASAARAALFPRIDDANFAAAVDFQNEFAKVRKAELLGTVGGRVALLARSTPAESKALKGWIR